MRTYKKLSVMFAVGLLLGGCRHASPPSPLHEKPLPLVALHQPLRRPAPTDAELAHAGVNEVGTVPILEYHNLKAGRAMTFRTPRQFRNDLNRLLKERYRPISLRDYLHNRIDLPIGMHPVILTFDDACRTQFRYLPDGRIDPDCAVGIMQEFHTAHPDFPLNATFFYAAARSFRLATRRSAQDARIGRHGLRPAEPYGHAPLFPSLA